MQVPTTHCVVPGLVPGKEYEFRVAAVNDAGPGDYSEASQGLVAQQAPCTFLIHVP